MENSLEKTGFSKIETPLKRQDLGRVRALTVEKNLMESLTGDEGGSGGSGGSGSGN